MKVLINTIPLLGEQTGVGNYTRQIARALAARQGVFDPVFFYGYYSKKLSGAAAEGETGSLLTKIKELAAQQTLIRRICKKALTVTSAAYSALRGVTYDCYHEPNFILLPTIRARRAVLTAHDFSCFLHPQWHPVERVRHMEKYFRGSLKRADYVITISETIRREAMELFGLAPERIRVIHNGVEHGCFRPYSPESLIAFRRKYSLPERFILYVGTMEPRKNLYNLLLAHAALPDALKKSFPLILVGSKGWNNADILNLIKKHPAHARLLGYVPEADLPAFYSAASLFAYPSWYEGFGLPVLEAMACGCPVLTSDHAALVEVCGGAARHTPPGDVSAMSECLREMLEESSLRADLHNRGLERAAMFSWEKSARKHLELFAELCAS